MANTSNHESICIDVALYGSLARLGGGQYVAQVPVELERGASIADLLSQLKVQEKGYLFVNSVLCDVPGLTASLGEVLCDGDHVGIFSIDYMWPYQYRDGVRMSESLKAVLREQGAMHHTYTSGAKA